MNCPYCGSTHLEESSNFNEFSCNFCKCEFKGADGKYRIFEDGNYKKFCENVMYNLCESASPKVSHILVSLIGQLKNNGVEEVDAILEHLMLVSANVSSEMVIGLQTEADLEVVQEGIKHFTTIGNTLLKRDDLELDLHRFTRFQEANSFYETVYSTPKGLSDMQLGAVDENAINDLGGEPAPEASATDVPATNPSFSMKSPDAVKQQLDSVYSAFKSGEQQVQLGGSAGLGGMVDIKTAIQQVLDDAKNLGPEALGPNAGYYTNMISQLSTVSGTDPRAGGGFIGGISDTPDAMAMSGDVDDVPPEVAETAQLPVDTGSDPAGEPTQIPGIPPEGISPEDQAAAFSTEEMQKIAETMADGYRTGAISEEADFAEALMNCEAANGLCENLGSMSEEQVYGVAQMVQEMLSQPSTPEVATGLDEVSPEQLEEALEILTKSAKLMNGELKDL